jgi:hypothetical protein
MRSTITIFLSRKSLASLKKFSVISNIIKKTEKIEKTKKGTNSGTISVWGISFISGTVPEDPRQVVTVD